MGPDGGGVDMANNTTTRHDVIVAARKHGWYDVEFAWGRSRFTRGETIIYIDWSVNGGMIVSATRQKDDQTPVERLTRTDSGKRAQVLAWLREDGQT